MAPPAGHSVRRCPAKSHRHLREVRSFDGDDLTTAPVRAKSLRGVSSGLAFAASGFQIEVNTRIGSTVNLQIGSRLASRKAPTVALVAAALVAGCFATEVGLRLAGFSHASLYVYDERRGWTLRPGIENRVRTEAGQSFVRTSSAGLRDREHSLAKPPRVVRVAVLGDSFAEALQVAAEQTFWAVLERELGRCPAYAGLTVEVMNFGVGGYGTAQELLMLQDQALEYRPDLV
jgi:hypothetical protein